MFIDGCFWHCCPIHQTFPKVNADWWQLKLAKNVTRDRDTDAVLKQLGWLPIRIWEHEKVEDAVEKVVSSLVGR